MFTVWITILILSVESVIKQVREQNGFFGERKLILQDKIYLTKYHNKGAFLNIFSKNPIFLKGLSVGLCAICTVIYVFSLGRKGKLILNCGLATLLGGAYSNTYDRLVRGYVIDYFGFCTNNKFLKKVVFNISDFAIMLGTAICLIKGI